MKLPKLHIRDLFWLVLVCALATGWWVESARLRSEIEALRSSDLDFAFVKEPYPDNVP